MQRCIAKHHVELAAYHDKNLIWNSDIMRIAYERVPEAILLGFRYLEGLSTSVEEMRV